jgi:hypothetical protein
LLLCKLALHASGFELQKGKGHHSYWINSLEFTLGKQQKDTLIHLSKSSHLRHTASMTKVALSRSRTPMTCLKLHDSSGRTSWPGCTPSTRPWFRQACKPIPPPPTNAPEFFVPFLVLVMNHEHKEYPILAKISRKAFGSRESLERLEKGVLPGRARKKSP